jgi:mono/diheme cytochrome c family protein
VPKLNELRDQSLGWWVVAADAELVAVQVTKENLLMKRVVCLVTFLALSVAVSHVHAQATGDPREGLTLAQATGDPREGLTLAQQVCSECHAIRRGQVRSPNSRAPTFLELATAPGMTIAALSVALTTPHAGMPMFRFTTEQREDVIAYILSLR